MRGVTKTGTPSRLEAVWRADVEDHVAALASSPDGALVAVAGVEGRITLLDAKSGEIRHLLSGHGFGTAALSWDPSGRLLASAGQDGKVRLWEAGGGGSVALDGGAAWVEHVAWSPDGRHLASAAGRCLRMWRPRGGGELLWESSGHASTVSGLQWRTGSGKDLATSAYGGVTLWRTGSPEPVRRYEWKGSTVALAWSPNGRYIATGDQDATVHLWNVKSGRDLQMWGYPTKVRELAWSPTSRYLATGGGPMVTVWDCSGRGPEGTRPLELEAHEDFVSALAYAKGGSALASGGRDGVVAVWAPGRNGRVPLALEHAGSGIARLAWTPDDRLLVAGCESGAVVGFGSP
jgi:WD40 repeat protein